ncbi:hypothetical protein [Lentzea sp. NPDC092896]|uniref:hypothetical protein n=1 Tax=Lentzea sp. NPDC092896 TaxID=3364127 RepID=UPI00381BA2BB
MTDQSVHPEASAPPFRFGPWSWREPVRGEHFRRCSYCGSVNPDDLAAEPVWCAEWADRKYGWPHKFYVDIPNRDPARLYVLGSSSGPNPPTESRDWIARSDVSAEQREALERDDYFENDSRTHFLFGPRPLHHAKFYSIHLRDAELDPAVKAAIEPRCGLTFVFDGTSVAWHPAATEPVQGT